ncbi:hypothetical protein GE09DRAFT_330315 [Coniochaeta sp. 2T2.1]|nr:hypothetical protein GE09DRAFT_330315 [Coniochaeta sp. 2T2.1]
MSSDALPPSQATTSASLEPISPPNVEEILLEMLHVLPVAAMGAQPSDASLKRLSPDLKRRVKVLSSLPADEGSSGEAPSEPWLRLLCYSKDQTPQLLDIARSELFELHPNSGEIEVDWSSDNVDVRYKRVDAQSLHAMVLLNAFNLFFDLVYCIENEAAGEWRVHEVGVAHPTYTNGSLVNKVMEPHYGGSATIAAAEMTFTHQEAQRKAAAEARAAAKAAALAAGSPRRTPGIRTPYAVVQAGGSQTPRDTDEDDYWNSYNTDDVGRTPPPGNGRSAATTSQFQARGPVFPSNPPTGQNNSFHSRSSSDSNHYAQYSSVQPALDNHDPDEAAAHNLPVLAPTSLVDMSAALRRFGSPRLAPSGTADNTITPPISQSDRETGSADSLQLDGRSRSSTQRSQNAEGLLHPRPSSSLSSSPAGVAKLEKSVEFAVTKHVQSSVRSLFALCKASGIDRAEFERLVKTELDIVDMYADS